MRTKVVHNEGYREHEGAAPRDPSDVTKARPARDLLHGGDDEGRGATWRVRGAGELHGRQGQGHGERGDDPGDVNGVPQPQSHQAAQYLASNKLRRRGKGEGMTWVSSPSSSTLPITTKRRAYVAGLGELGLCDAKEQSGARAKAADQK